MSIGNNCDIKENSSMIFHSCPLVHLITHNGNVIPSHSIQLKVVLFKTLLNLCRPIKDVMQTHKLSVLMFIIPFYPRAGTPPKVKVHFLTRLCLLSQSIILLFHTALSFSPSSIFRTHSLYKSLSHTTMGFVPE